jgi:hypothetical protein
VLVYNSPGGVQVVLRFDVFPVRDDVNKNMLVKIVEIVDESELAGNDVAELNVQRFTLIVEFT